MMVSKLDRYFLQSKISIKSPKNDKEKAKRVKIIDNNELTKTKEIDCIGVVLMKVQNLNITWAENFKTVDIEINAWSSLFLNIETNLILYLYP